MANILGARTLDNLRILKVDTDPSLTGGVSAVLGSFATAADGSGFYLKIGALTTEWLTVGLGGGAIPTNTALGYQALTLNVTGLVNTAIGYASLTNNIGSSNTALGYNSGRDNTSGGNNVYIGESAGRGNTTGNGNTAIGKAAGLSNIGDGNVYIGFDAGRYAVGESNRFYLGNKDLANTSQDKTASLMYGVFGVTMASQTLAINAKIITSITGYNTYDAMHVVVGSDTTLANYAFKAKNSVGVELLTIRNDGSVGIGVTPDAGSRLYIVSAAPSQNGISVETVGGYAIQAFATGGGTAIFGRAGGANSTGIEGYNLSSSGTGIYGHAINGIGGHFYVTAAGGISLSARGANSLATDYTMQLKDGSANALLYVRNDGWVGAGAGTPNSAYSTFSHRATAFAPLGYFWADFFNNTGTTGITLKQSGFFTNWVDVVAGSFGAGFGNALALDCTAGSEEASIGGYPYAGGGSFRVQTNNGGLVSGKAFAIGSGEHLINQGPRTWYYGASLSSSNSQDKYGHFEYLKENNTDGNFKAYLSIGVNDGALSTATIERMKISSNGQINFNFVQVGSAGLGSGDIYQDGLTNALFIVP